MKNKMAKWITMFLFLIVIIMSAKYIKKQNCIRINNIFQLKEEIAKIEEEPKEYSEEAIQYLRERIAEGWLRDNKGIDYNWLTEKQQAIKECKQYNDCMIYVIEKVNVEKMRYVYMRLKRIREAEEKLSREMSR